MQLTIIYTKDPGAGGATIRYDVAGAAELGMTTVITAAELQAAGIYDSFAGAPESLDAGHPYAVTAGATPQDLDAGLKGIFQARTDAARPQPSTTYQRVYSL